jgi:hypothetical protein
MNDNDQQKLVYILHYLELETLTEHFYHHLKYDHTNLFT